MKVTESAIDDGGDKSSSILRAAAQVFAERGYEAATVEAIAEHARIAKCNGPRYSGRSGQIVTQRFCRGLSLSLDSFRTVLAVKGSLRRAYRRALDSSGPF